MNTETVANMLIEAIKPVVSIAGTGTVAAISKKLAEEVFEKVKQKFYGNNKLETALDATVTNKGDEQSLVQLQNSLKEEMEKDDSLKIDLQTLLEEFNLPSQNSIKDSLSSNIASTDGRITTADRGGLAIGGSVHGSVYINPKDNA
jgi:hypothetical protein